MPYIPRIGETLSLYVKDNIGGGFRTFKVVHVMYTYANKQYYDITVYVEKMGATL